MTNPKPSAWSQLSGTPFTFHHYLLVVAAAAVVVVVLVVDTHDMT